MESTPADAPYWSTRSLARTLGLNQTALSRIWRAFGLKPHLTEAFKLSTDPQFIDKVRDIVGLYLNPPEPPWSCAWMRRPRCRRWTAPVLPLLSEVTERRTHDYRRHGTTNLYAALDVASGKVITDLTDRHRAIEFGPPPSPSAALDRRQRPIPGGASGSTTWTCPWPWRRPGPLTSTLPAGLLASNHL